MLNGQYMQDMALYSKLTVTGVLQKSSNVSVSKLSLAMPSSALLKIYSRFGLGKATNLGLVGESSGLYPHKKRWSDIDKGAFSYGYVLMVKQLQLARAYATIRGMGIYARFLSPGSSLP